MFAPVDDLKLRMIAAAASTASSVYQLRKVFHCSEKTVRRALALYAPERFEAMGGKSPAVKPAPVIPDADDDEPAPEIDETVGPLLIGLRRYHETHGMPPPGMRSMPKTENEARLAIAMAHRANAGTLDYVMKEEGK